MREPGESGHSAVELKHLAAGYRNHPVLTDVSLAIPAGKITALIGPNGAGKSTLLNTITGEIPAIGGEVRIAGTPLASIPGKELARYVAVVLTDRIRSEHMTGRDIAAAGRYPYTGVLGRLTPADEAKVDEALRLVHADEIADRPFDRASDGEKQRILLARAIAQEPEILVLDEPTSFLDIRYKLELLTILRKLVHDRGLTVICSLHEVDLAGKIADRILSVSRDHRVTLGEPSRALLPDAIRELFGITAGSFDPLTGNAELGRISGEPEVLVISSGGAGIPVYRELEKKGIPFAAGILFENDVDLRAARQLASEVISAAPFCPVPEETRERAKNVIDQVKQVIYAGGPAAPEVRELLSYARARGKLVCGIKNGG